jgi:hypothetical protein
MSNTADVTGGKPIAFLSQSLLNVNAINPVVTFYDIHGRKREVLLFYFAPDTTRPSKLLIVNMIFIKYVYKSNILVY